MEPIRTDEPNQDSQDRPLNNDWLTRVADRFIHKAAAPHHGHPSTSIADSSWMSGNGESYAGGSPVPPPGTGAGGGGDSLHGPILPPDRKIFHLPLLEATSIYEREYRKGVGASTRISTRSAALDFAIRIATEQWNRTGCPVGFAETLRMAREIEKFLNGGVDNASDTA